MSIPTLSGDSMSVLHALHRSFNTYTNNVAVASWDGDMTYGELDRASTSLAIVLQNNGVRRDDFVVLCMPKSKWAVVAMVGVLKAGAAFTHLDAAYPPERMRTITKACRAKVMVHMPATNKAAEAVQLTSIELPACLEWTPESSALPNVGTQNGIADPICYILFTSGSTGTPKGALIPHSSLCASMAAHGGFLEFGPGVRVFQFSSYTFDAAIIETLTVLYFGAVICIPTEESRLNDLTGALNATRSQIALITPSVARLLQPADLPHLEKMVLVGEAVDQGLLDLWAPKRLLNAYGPTECAIVTAMVEYDADVIVPATIGSPLGCRVWVVNPDNVDELLERGEVGELLVSGPIVGAGYLDEPVKTAAAFIPYPKWARAHLPEASATTKMYRTGDLVKYSAHRDHLIFVSRKDNQVKLHGQRLELGEVNHHLSSSALVKHSLVFVPKSGPCREQLTAIVAMADAPSESASDHGEIRLLPQVAGSIGESTTRQLAASLGQKLPAYMVPTRWILVVALPRTIASKLDAVQITAWVNNLNAEDYRKSMSGCEQVVRIDQTDSPQEQILLSAWRKTLKDDGISTGQDFFQAGGDSILSMQIVANARAQGLSVTVQQILKYRTIKAIARHGQWLQSRHQAEVAVQGEEDDNGEEFPLTPIQQMYFQIDAEGRGMFNQSSIMNVLRPITAEQMKAGLAALVDRHSMLRARFARTSDSWTQRISERSENVFSFQSFETQSEDEAEAIMLENENSLDIARGPVFRAALVRVKDEVRLHMVAHHLVIDLVSWRIIMDDLETIFAKSAAALFAEPCSFRYWALQQRKRAERQFRVDESVARRIPKLDAKYWALDLDLTSYSDVTEEGFVLDAEATSSLLGVSNIALSTEPIDLFLAALILSFERVFGQTSHGPLQLFNEGHGRESWDPQINLSETLGWFTAIFPILSDGIHASSSLIEAVRSVKSSRRKMAHNGFDYFSTRYLTEDGRIQYQNHSIPMEVLFNYAGVYSSGRPSPDQGFLEPRATSEVKPFEERRSGRPFTVFEFTSVVVHSQLRIYVHFNKNIGRRSEIGSWIAGYRSALEELAVVLPREPPQLFPEEFPLLRAGDAKFHEILRAVQKHIGSSGLSNIADIYPCTPMQTGILVSQDRAPHLYETHIIWEVNSELESIDIDRMKRAWSDVVDRNNVLRTIFVQGDDGFSQVVLKEITSSKLTEVREAGEDLEVISTPRYAPSDPHHRLLIQQRTQRTLRIRLDINHALMDGRTLEVLVDQLATAYSDSLSSSEACEYSLLLRHLQGIDTTSDLAHWSKYLAGAQPCHFPHLATEAASVSVTAPKMYHGWRDLHFEVGDRSRLQRFCSEHNVSIFTLVQLAWGLVLSKYTGQHSFCFGYLVSGRDLPFEDILNAVGPYINMLVQRLDIDACLTAVQALQAIRRDSDESMEHSRTALKDILRASNSNAAHLFNTTISYQRTYEGVQDRSGLRFRRVSAYDPSEDCMTMDVDDYGDYLDPYLTYWQSFVTDEQAQRVASTFAQAIDAIIAFPHEPLRSLNLVSSEHMEELLKWNGGMPEDFGECLHHLVERQVLLRPDAIAVHAWDVTFTYHELDDLANRLAEFLVDKMHIEVEQVVPCCFHKSGWAIVTSLAILKAGGACVHLDVTHPEARLVRILEETKGKFILVDAATRSTFTKFDIPVHVIAQDFVRALPSSAKKVQSAVGPDNLAWLVYTSGSTGQPKGILYEHRGLCNDIAAHSRAFRITSQTRAFQFASYIFDVSIEDTYATFSRGGCVCVPSDEDRRNNISRAINDLGANWAHLVPTVARVISPESVPGLKTLVVGGERLPSDVVQLWANKVKLINSYGPAECSINSHYNDAITDASDGSNIGRALDCCRIWIVDVEDPNQLVPIGCVGELVVDGPIIMRAYHNDPDRTQAVFLTNPKWIKDTGDLTPRTMYRSGDLARHHGDGTYVIVGRKDAQKKLRGQRIDLGEIQLCLSQCRGVHKCIVRIADSGPCQDKLVAVLVLEGYNESTQSMQLVRTENSAPLIEALETIRAELLSNLTPYMVPAIWAVVKAVPSLPSGKLDGRQVSIWLNEMSEETFHYITGLLQGEKVALPTTVNEEKILKAWSLALNKPADQIGVNAGFLAFGGDSISAMLARARIREMGLNVTVEAIMRGSTIREIAKTAMPIGALLTLTDQNPHAPFDLSPIQRTYLNEDTSDPLPRYNQGMLLQLKRAVTNVDIEKALNTLVGRHDMLRSKIVKDSGRWRQLIVDKNKARFGFGSHGPLEEIELDFVIEAAQAEVNIQDSLVLVARVIEMVNGQRLLFLTAHHLAIDLVSWRIFLSEIESLLNHAHLTTPSPLSFRNWRGLQDSQYLAEDSKVVPDIGASKGALQHRNGTYADAADISFVLDEAVSSRILSICNEPLRTEAVELLIAAMIFSYTKAFGVQKLPVVLNESHGRESWDASIDPSATIGWFTTMSRVEVEEYDSKTTPISLITSVKSWRRKLVRNGYDWFTNGILSGHGIPEADILFNYAGSYQQLESDDGLFKRLVPDVVEKTSVDPCITRPAAFEVAVGGEHGRLHWNISYNKSTHNHSEVQTWTQFLERVLGEISMELPTTVPRLTTGDFALVNANEASFRKLIEEAVQKANLQSENDIEDIYPVTGIQEGMLISQVREGYDSGQYAISVTWEIESARGNVDIRRLENAWQSLINSHSILRTFFLETPVDSTGLFAQIVLRSVKAAVHQVDDAPSADEAICKLKSLQLPSYWSGPPLHRMILCRTDVGRVFCRLDFSHTLIDGMSVSNLLEQLVAVYEGSNAVQDSFYRKLVSYISRSNIQDSLQYWRTQLAGVEPCHFPKLAKAPASSQLQFSSRMVAFPHQDRVQTFCLEHSVTTFNIIQTAWSIVLRSYTNAEVVSFGYLISGRDLPIDGIDKAVGPFINIVGCKVDASPSRSISDMLQDVRENFMGSLAHQTVSLGQVNHALGLDGQNLFNTVISFQKETQEMVGKDLSFRAVGSEDPSEYDITLGVNDTSSGLLLSLHYSDNTLDNQQAEYLAEALEMALEQIICGLQRTVGDIDLLGSSQLTQLAEWNSKTPISIEETIHRQFSTQAQCSPEDVAIESWDGRLTYYELDSLSSQLATDLLSKEEIAGETIIPLCFEKSMWTVVAVLSVLKAGGAVVFLPINSPTDQLRSILERTEASFVLSDVKSTNMLKELGVRFHCIDENVRLLPCRDLHAAVKVEPSNSAFIVFTSGSTGNSKAIVLEHVGICSDALAEKYAHGVDSSRRHFAFAGYTFDVAITDMMTTLLNGGCVCIPSEDERINDITGAINRLQANSLMLTPTVARMIQPEDAPGIKRFICSGEALPQDVATTWASRVCLINSYGPAEASVNASAKIIRSTEDAVVSNIGPALQSTRLWVVDPIHRDTLAPIGAIGELIIEGPGIARCYLKDPERTNKAFMDTPAWACSLLEAAPTWPRWHCSGDLVRYAADGTLDYLGRKDSQTKLHGRRIDLGFVESSIISLLSKDWRVAVEILAVPDEDRTLVAFLSRADHIDTGGSALTPSLDDEHEKVLLDLRRDLRNCLPAYSIPTIVSLLSMPLTASKKILRRRLRELGSLVKGLKASSALSSQQKRSPQTKTEKLLQILWSEILRLPLDRIGLDDNFFDLGGDSVRAMNLVQVARRTSLGLTVGAIFQTKDLEDAARRVSTDVVSIDGTPTLSDAAPFELIQASNVQSMKEVVSRLCSAAIESIEDILPCTPLQEGLFALSTKEPGSYIAQSYYQLSDTVNLGLLQAAWQAVADREPILRTRFVYVNNQGMLQVVLKENISWVQSQEFPFISAEYGQQLTRWAYNKSSEGPGCLRWSIHHALYDGVSIELLLRKVEATYAGVSVPKGPPFANYIRYIHESAVQGRAGEFWKHKFENTNPAVFPARSSIPGASCTNGALQQRLSLATLPNRITAANVLRAAWAIVLSQHTNSPDVLFGMTLSGRNAPIEGLSDLIGPCIATVPVRVVVHSTDTVQTLLQSVQRDAAEMMPHEHLGLTKIASLFETDHVSPCDFQNLLVIQPRSPSAPGASVMASVNGDSSAFKETYPLVLQCELQKDYCDLHLSYNEQIIPSTSAKWLLEHFANVVDSLIKSADDTPIRDISLVSTNMIQSFQQWNGPLPSLEDRCVHQIFTDRVRDDPTRPAVDAADGTFSYGELEIASTALAHRLQSLGVQPHIKVPICFGKSAFAIVSIIAILKAGGAYVPLDPAHPTERLQELVAQTSDCVVLIGSESERSKFSSKNTHVLLIDQKFVTMLEAQAYGPLIDKSRPDHPAYILFTSGSTGKPKGVVLKHSTVSTSAREHAKAMRMRSNSRILNYSSLTFDASVAEILTALMIGACICVPSDGERMDDISTAMRKLRVSWAILTPTVAALLTGKFQDLQTLVFCGEAVSHETIVGWEDHIDLLSVYGPTETCVIVCAVDLRRQFIPHGLLGTAVGGKPWLVDPTNHDRLVPPGCPGEVVISGLTLADGYLNDPVKTASAFRQSPSWLADLDPQSTRIYITGDLACHLPNGELQYLGRKEATQIKINGQRVEVGEIEQCVSRAVESQVVVEICHSEHRPGQALLTAFIVKSRAYDGESHNQLVDLREKLVTQLPAYMIPVLLVPMTSFPRSMAGKVDRKLLRARVASLSREDLQALSWSRRTQQRDLTSAEFLLCAMWSQILGMAADQIGPDDSFFALGGNSIDAIKLSALARKQNQRLTVQNIFAEPSLATLAKYMVEDDEDREVQQLASFSLWRGPRELDSLAADCGVSVSNIENIYPCSPLQEGLMALSETQPGAYIGRHQYAISKAIDVYRFQQAWDTVVARNPILRTRIVNTQFSGTVQVVLRHSPIVWNTELPSPSCRNGQDHNMSYGDSLTKFSIHIDAASEGHAFEFAAHHAVYDGWSIPLLINEAQNAYHQGRLEKSVGSFDQFIAFIEGNKDASRQFWVNELQDHSPAPFPKIPDPGYQASTKAITQRDIVLSDKLPSKFSTSVLIRAAWALLVSKYSNSHDVIFGATLSGRNAPLPGLMELPAPTFTTVPVRIRLEDQKTLAEFLQQIHDRYVAAIPFEHFGLQQISRLFPGQDSPCNFNNLLIIQPKSTQNASAPIMVPIEHERDSAPMSETYGIVLEVITGQDQLSLRVHYDTNLLTSEQIGWICTHFETSLQLMYQADDEVLLSELTFASGEDHQQVHKWNTKLPEPVKTCIHTAFHERAVLSPASKAIEATLGGHWLYSELDKASSRFALHLIALGVKVEDKVPLMVEKSAWAMIAMLGILKAGGAYVPLDPQDSPARRKTIIDDTNAQLAILDTSTESIGSDWHIPTIKVDDSMDQWPILTGSEVWPAESHNAAYIIYTSGSTGKPKGVVMEHSAVMASSKAHAKAMFIDETQRVFYFSSPTFDVHVAETLTALLHGSCICIPSAEERLGDIAATMRRFHVTWAFFTPSVVTLIRPEDVPGLKVLTLGGEAVSQDNARTWATKTTLIVGYGPSETCVFSSAAIITNPEQHSGWIGHTIGGHIWIVDPGSTNLTPVGCVGELLISGPTLAREYLNSPKKTASTFIDAPDWLRSFYGGLESVRAYRTGDLARFNTDGSVTYCGRQDRQVKVNGQRVELGEIEYQLSSFKPIRNSIVLVPKEGIFASKLIAVVETHSTAPLTNANNLKIDTSVSTAAIVRDGQTYLNGVLPRHMLPTLWIPVSRLPQNASGKIHRTAVSAWVQEAQNEISETLRHHLNKLGTQERLPVNQIETRLRSLWAEVLNVPADEIALDVPFTQFGADSISAIQLATKARKSGLMITAQQIMTTRTIARLSGIAREEVSQPTKTEFIVNEDYFDLTPIQTMYFEAMADHNGGHFNQSFLLDIASTVEPEAIEEGIQNLVSRHAMLRVTFDEKSPGKWQQRCPSSTFHAEHTGFQHYIGLSLADIQSTIDKAQAAVNKYNGLVFSAILFTNENSNTLFLVADHLVIDLVSWRVIFAELEQLFSGQNLKLLTGTSFQEWATIQSAQSKANLDPLKTVPAPIVPANMDFWGGGANARTFGTSIEQSFTVEQDVSLALLGTCNSKFNTETLDLLLAAAYQSFSTVFSERNLPCVYIEGHGREAVDAEVDLSQTIGWFTTMFPCGINVQNTTDTVEFIRKCKDTRAAIPGRGQPYFAARYNTSAGREAFGNHDQMEILLNYQGAFQQLETAGALVSQSGLINQGIVLNNVSPAVRRPALVDISIAVQGANLEVSFIWDRNLLHQERLKEWASSYPQQLSSMVQTLLAATPTLTLSDVPLFRGAYAQLDRIQEDARTVLGEKATFEDIIPCSSLAERMLAAQRQNETLYQVRAMWRIATGNSISVDAARLQSAWQRVVKLHSMLRKVLVYDVGGSFHVVPHNVDARFESHTLQSRTEVQSLMNQCLVSTNQLPVLELFSTAEGEQFIILRISHTRCDATSIAILLNDLRTEYRQDPQSRPHRVQRHPIECLQSGAQEDGKTYWQNHFKPARPCLLSPRHTAAISRISHRTYSLTIDYLHKSKTKDSTIATVLQAAWAVALQEHTQSNNVSFGYLTSGRDSNLPEIEHSVGLFVQLSVCHVDIPTKKNLRPADLLELVQNNVTAALPHHATALECSDAAAERHGQRHLFDTIFNFQKSSIEDVAPVPGDDGLDFEYCDGKDPMEFAIVVRVTESEGSVQVYFDYDEEAIPTNRLMEIAHSYQKAVRWIVEM